MEEDTQPEGTVTTAELRSELTSMMQENTAMQNSTADMDLHQQRNTASITTPDGLLVPTARTTPNSSLPTLLGVIAAGNDSMTHIVLPNGHTEHENNFIIISNLYCYYTEFKAQNQWLLSKKLKNQNEFAVDDLTTGVYTSRNHRQYSVRLWKNVIVEKGGCKLKYCGTCHKLVDKNRFDILRLPQNAIRFEIFTVTMGADATDKLRETPIILTVRRDLSQAQLQQTCEPCKDKKRIAQSHKEAVPPVPATAYRCI
jgi:hypothetical protein